MLQNYKADFVVIAVIYHALYNFFLVFSNAVKIKKHINNIYAVDNI